MVATFSRRSILRSTAALYGGLTLAGLPGCRSPGTGGGALAPGTGARGEDADGLPAFEDAVTAHMVKLKAGEAYLFDQVPPSFFLAATG